MNKNDIWAGVAIIFLALAPTFGNGCGGAESSVESPGYALYDHPCETHSDCDEGQYCGSVGRGTEPPAEFVESGPQETFCLRENSSDYCPPSAPRQN